MEHHHMVNQIMKYERGNMDFEEEIEMYQELLDTGIIFKLQGHYQRRATVLLQSKLITMPKGESK